ncbi:hypothetical protein [Leifsonia xyli]|uniref:hypothetical protein n=1 Tax=Leifsonia xyli TaxID=1575 RepID=UPI003D679CA5
MIANTTREQLYRYLFRVHGPAFMIVARVMELSESDDRADAELEALTRILCASDLIDSGKHQFDPLTSAAVRKAADRLRTFEMDHSELAVRPSLKRWLEAVWAYRSCVEARDSMEASDANPYALIEQRAAQIHFALPTFDELRAFEFEEFMTAGQFSQESLSRLSGVSTTVIQKLQEDNAEPSIEAWEALMRAIFAEAGDPVDQMRWAVIRWENARRAAWHFPANCPCGSPDCP